MDYFIGEGCISCALHVLIFLGSNYFNWGGIMGFSTHPSVVLYPKGNYESWHHGIPTHVKWIDMLPYLYQLILELVNPRGELPWSNIIEYFVGVICSSIDYDVRYVLFQTLCVLAHFGTNFRICRHTIISLHSQIIL